MAELTLVICWVLTIPGRAMNRGSNDRLGFHKNRSYRAFGSTGVFPPSVPGTSSPDTANTFLPQTEQGRLSGNPSIDRKSFVSISVRGILSMLFDDRIPLFSVGFVAFGSFDDLTRSFCNPEQGTGGCGGRFSIVFSVTPGSQRGLPEHTAGN